MKRLYLSRPLDSRLKNNVRLIQKRIMEYLTNKNIMLDPNNQYEFVNVWDWDDNDAHKDVKRRTYELANRMKSMGNADHYIFMEEWMDLPECQVDWAVLRLHGWSNHIMLKAKDDSFVLSESLPWNEGVRFTL